MLLAIQAIIGVLLTLAILLQTRAAGLSANLSAAAAQSYTQRRGAEKLLFQATIVMSVVYFSLTIVQWYL